MFLRNAVTKDYKQIGTDYLKSIGKDDTSIEKVFPKSYAEVQKEKLSYIERLELVEI